MPAPSMSSFLIHGCFTEASPGVPCHLLPSNQLLQYLVPLSYGACGQEFGTGQVSPGFLRRLHLPHAEGCQGCRARCHTRSRAWLAPLHVDLSQDSECPQRVTASSRANHPGEPGTSCNAFCDFAAKATRCHFRSVLSILKASRVSV